MSSPQLSIQLYSLRRDLSADLDSTLGRLSEIGFRAVEAYDFVDRAAELAAALGRHGLTSPTGHAPLASDVFTREDGEVPAPALSAVLDAAAELSMAVVIDPMVPSARWASSDEVRRTAERLNRASAAASAYGIAVGYHNHSFEFHHTFGGVTAYELFVSELDETVVLELDCYWAQVGGQDVTALVERLGSRVKALHVKDGSVDYDPFLTGEFDASLLGQVPAGTGAVPLGSILDIAPGIDYAIVEYDAFPGDLFEAIAATVEFLADRGVS